MLAFQRATAVRRMLVEQEQLNPARFRVSSASDSEPMSRTGGSGNFNRNPRVEVFLLDETVEDLHGTADERKAATIEVGESNGERP